MNRRIDWVRLDLEGFGVWRTPIRFRFPDSLGVLHRPNEGGKSTLVAEWLSTRGGRTAWLSVDREDSEPAVFLRYFLEAIHLGSPGAGRELLATLRFQDLPPVATSELSQRPISSGGFHLGMRAPSETGNRRSGCFTT